MVLWFIQRRHNERPLQSQSMVFANFEAMSEMMGRSLPKNFNIRLQVPSENGFFVETFDILNKRERERQRQRKIIEKERNMHKIFYHLVDGSRTSTIQL